MVRSTALPKTRDYAGEMEDQQMADQMASLGAGIPALLRQQRTLNMRSNPGLKAQQAPGAIEQAIPGALINAGIPDMFEGADNKQFWDTNAKLTALTEPGSGSFRASTGPRPSPIGGASMARPVDSLQGMSSFGGNGRGGGGEVTASPGGNYSRGPAVSDQDLAMQGFQRRDAEHRLTEAERTPEQVASEAAVLAKSAGETNIGLNTEAEIAGAKNYFQPDVYRANESKANAAAAQTKARYLDPAEIKGAYELRGKEVGGNAQLGVAEIKARNAAYMSQISNLRQASGAMMFGDPQIATNERTIKFLQDEIAKSGVDAPQVPLGLTKGPQ